MILKAISPGESWVTGAHSGVKTTSSSAQVIYCEFASPPPSLHDTVALESLVSEFESDAEMSQEMEKARRALTDTLYHDEPDTLSALRLSAGLSQAQLAKLVKTSQPYIARIEKGITDPGTDIIARIAKALDVDDSRVFKAIRIQISTRETMK